MQAADRRAEVAAGAVIGGCRCRDDEPSFELKGVVAAARLDADEGHTFGTAELVVFSYDLTHGVKPVICDIPEKFLASLAKYVNR